MSTIDRVLDWLCRVIILGVFLAASLSYAHLPDQIPIHFNVHGVADGYGAKYYIFGLPIIALALYFLKSIHTNSVKVLRYIRLSVLVVLAMALAKILVLAL